MFAQFGHTDESATAHCGGPGLGLPVLGRFSRMPGSELTLPSVPGAGAVLAIGIAALLTRAPVLTRTRRLRLAISTRIVRADPFWSLLCDY